MDQKNHGSGGVRLGFPKVEHLTLVRSIAEIGHGGWGIAIAFCFLSALLSVQRTTQEATRVECEACQRRWKECARHGKSGIHIKNSSRGDRRFNRAHRSHTRNRYPYSRIVSIRGCPGSVSIFLRRFVTKRSMLRLVTRESYPQTSSMISSRLRARPARWQK